MAEKLLILYASQTGNAQDVAERIGREALRRHYSPLVLSMDSCDPALLSLSKACIFVAATTGQGDPPDNMRSFWRFLLRKSLPFGCLQHLQYAVFGLGDSGYLKYNIVAKKLDRRLLDLGARPLVPRGLGDDQHPSGYEAALDPWLANFWSALRQVISLPHGLSEPSDSDALVLDPPKFKITYLSKAHCKLDATLATEASKDELKGALKENEDALRGSNEQVTAASASGDELEENLQAIAVLDAATDASSGVLLTGEKGGLVKQVNKRKGYSQVNPYLATMVANDRLTSAENEQDVRHIELDLGDSGIAYEPGDIINVMPENSADIVARFCQRCGLDPDARIVIEPWDFAAEKNLSSESSQSEITSNGVEHADSKLQSGRPSKEEAHQRNGPVRQESDGVNGLDGSTTISYGHGVLGGKNGTTNGGEDHRSLNGDVGMHPLASDDSDAQATARFGPVRIGALVRAALDVASASPRRYFFEVLSHFATAEHEIERLQYFATAEGRDDLYRYNQRERRTVLEVLDDFPSANLPLEWILQLVPRLKARAFSISSSLLAHPNQAHLTVAVVNFQTPYKRTRHGLCSHWLATLKPQTSNPVRLPVWVSKGFLRLPPPNVPMILVGPGTGCAPFRAFLEERTEGNEQSAPCLFFFGCRREKHDFLYREQWLSYTADGGVLSEARGGGLSVAFSRDQMLKVYVTHMIKEQGRKIWQLIQDGASIYVAGSANKMPADVARALEIVAQREGQMSQQQATLWLKELERNKRYHVEAWS